MASVEAWEKKMAAMEARLTELEDERAIRELLARYGFDADCGRDQAYTDLYTDDGRIDIRSYGGQILAEGRKQMREFIGNPKGHKAIEGRCLHLMGNNVVCHIKGNDAVVNSYNLTLVREGENIVVRTAGNNQWTLKKVKGTWLIKDCTRRHIAVKEYQDNLAATPA